MSIMVTAVIWTVLGFGLVLAHTGGRFSVVSINYYSSGVITYTLVLTVSGGIPVYLARSYLASGSWRSSSSNLC